MDTALRKAMVMRISNDQSWLGLKMLPKCGREINLYSVALPLVRKFVSFQERTLFLTLKNTKEIFQKSCDSQSFATH